tara:strand:+ start:213 stop:491 length:279 start_codon:yes stop_codon:yes gene_type:complete
MLIAVIILSILSMGLSYAVFRMARTIFGFEDGLTNAIEKIEESYEVVGKILERPLFLDSPEVREVHRQIGIVNDYLLDIAKDLSEVVESEEE